MKSKVKIEDNGFGGIFGGMGFHNSEAGMYELIEKEHFNQVICKTYREIAPGFMRAFAGFSDWTEEAMDTFVEYYEKMQKQTNTLMYFTPGRGKLHFSREEREQYAKDVADRLAYLVFEKDVKHLRYYCFSNELGQVSCAKLLTNLPLFKEYHELLYREFQKRGLRIGLLATDAANYDHWDTVDWVIEHMAQITEAFCLHHYECQHAPDDLTFYQWFYNACLEVSEKALRCDDKRFILGEFNITRPFPHPQIGARMDLGYYLHSDQEANSCLMLTEMIFAAINAGVFALGYWSFCDYPDPYIYAGGSDEWDEAWGRAEPFLGHGVNVRYNKWGLTKWKDGDYSARDTFWCIGLIAKYFKRNGRLLKIETDDHLLRICAMRNRDRSITIGIVNRHKKPTDLEIVLNFLPEKLFRRFEFDPQNVPRNKFADLQDYRDTLGMDGEGVLKVTLLPESVTLLTTDYQEKREEVTAQCLTVKDGILTWKAVDDPNHCYYRVYCGQSAGFAPSLENQIASTVATSLPVGSKYNYFKVYSVDKSGNCFC